MSGHKIKRCIGLFNSMIHCGEMHSPASERARQEAYEELDELKRKSELFDAIKWNSERGEIGKNFERAAKSILEKYKDFMKEQETTKNENT